LREIRRLRVSEYRLLRRIFGPKMDEVKGEWRKLNDDELNDLYPSTNIFRVIKSRRTKWAGHVACMGESKCVHGILVGKPEEKRPLGTPRRRWENYIKTDYQDVACGGHGLERSASGWGQVAGSCECGNTPSASITCGEFLY
jgi:hypothetical protein